MSKIVSLATRIEKALPAEIVEFLEAAGLIAASQGQGLYLVGGVVRDLLTGRTSFDLDMVVKGDAIGLSSRLAEIVRAKVTTHPRFGTATLRWDKWRADLVTARSETYARPGALPAVKADSLISDLFRRDFTINAMALELSPGHWGHLIDPCGGRNDLKQGLIRILHDKSFVDDATRMWRAIRYEQRLDFKIEPNTQRLLQRDVAMLDTISGDRIRHELELVLREESPEKALRRAEELGVLAKLHSDLKGNEWLAEKFTQARQMSASEAPQAALYMALLTFSLTVEEKERLISYLRLPRQTAQALRDTSRLRDRIDLLEDAGLAPSVVFHLLHSYAMTALAANALAADSQIVRRHIQIFLTKLRYVKASLSGDDLRKMGIKTGPQIRGILESLLEARLNGKAKSKKDEVELVRKWGTGRG